MTRRILVVDDEVSMCELLQADLQLRGYSVEWFTSAEKALDAFEANEFDVVLTDLNMPGMSGLQLCERVVANRPDVPVVVLTAFGSMETAVAAIRVGAYDFVTKPIEMDLLDLTLSRACNHHELQERVKRLEDSVGQLDGYAKMIGGSPAMKKLYSQLERIADTDASVLITGESGTGKELVAQALHEQSQRRSKPFVAVNCAALPEALMESELFGHKKGAFTDARTDRDGLFVQADGGTLFLDEIGELPLAMQPKLLRALEESRVRPVGSNQEVSFDVRFLAATNRDLEALIEEDRFREDLYFRLNVIQLDVPPLRNRGTDVLLIAQHLVQQFAEASRKQVTGISEPAAERLLNYGWPGNVRELRNVMERAVLLTRYEKVAVEDLPEKIRDYRSDQVVLGGAGPDELMTLEEVDRRYILHVLHSVGGNKAQAARILGLDRKTLYRKLSQYDIDSSS